MSIVSIVSCVQPTPIPIPFFSSSFSSSSSSCSRSSSSSLLLLAPPALLGLICQHLKVSDIVRLLRCCSHLLRSTADDAVFSGVAWSTARLVICQDWSLAQWMLPYHSCVTDSDGHKRIPLSAWQQAMPVMRYVVEQWDAAVAKGRQMYTVDRAWKRAANERMLKFKSAIATEQPTTTVREGDEDRVVLSTLSTEAVDAMLPWRRDPSYRAHFLLSATPHLQHLHLWTQGATVMPPPVVDTFANVPRLRSLRLSQLNRYATHVTDGTLPIRAVLAALPSLTALDCRGIPLAVQELVDIAAHATLEHIHLDTRNDHEDIFVVGIQLDEAWLGKGISFCTDANEELLERNAEEEEEEEQAEKAERQRKADGEPSIRAQTSVNTDVDEGEEVDKQDDEEQKDEEDDEGGQPSEAADSHADVIHRLRSALTRVQPFTRSIRARLALADLLSSKLRGQCPAGVERPTTSLRRHYRQQIAVLQSTLSEQLHSSGSPAVPSYSPIAGKRGTKRTRNSVGRERCERVPDQEEDGQGSE